MSSFLHKQTKEMQVNTTAYQGKRPTDTDSLGSIVSLALTITTKLMNLDTRKLISVTINHTNQPEFQFASSILSLVSTHWQQGYVSVGRVTHGKQLAVSTMQIMIVVCQIQFL